MSCKCLYYLCSMAHICTVQARIRARWTTLGGSVSRSKLQKHESSFKPALFTALIGCGVAQSSVRAACFQKMLENQQRFHWHATERHGQYSPGCYGYGSHPHVLMTVSCRHHSFTLLKMANYVKRPWKKISPLLLLFVAALTTRGPRRKNLEGLFFFPQATILNQSSWRW